MAGTNINQLLKNNARLRRALFFTKVLHERCVHYVSSIILFVLDLPLYGPALVVADLDGPQIKNVSAYLFAVGPRNTNHLRMELIIGLRF